MSTQIVESLKYYWASTLDRPIGRFFKLVRVVINDFMEGSIPLRATSLVYTTILSLVPLLALSFSVLKAFGVHNKLEPLLAQTLAPLGSKGEEITLSVVKFVDNMQVGVLGVLGLGILLFTVVSLISKIEEAFNDIWRIENTRTLGQKITSYLSVVTIGPIIIIVLIGLKTQLGSYGFINDTFGMVDSSTFGLTGLLFDFFVTGLVFATLNMLIPNTPVKFLPALYAGLSCAFLWKLLGFGFSQFLSRSITYDAIYASFAVAIVGFVWLYLIWLIMLIGGRICFYSQNSQYIELDYQKVTFSFAQLLDYAYKAMILVCQRHNSGDTPYTHEQLYEQFTHLALFSTVINLLVHHGLLVDSRSQPDAIVLAKSPNTITLKHIYDAVYQPHTLNTSASKPFASISAVQQQMDQLLNQHNLSDVAQIPDHQSTPSMQLSIDAR